MLKLTSLRFEFKAPTGIYFAPGKAANTLRGALGTIFRSMACVPGCQSAKTCETRDNCPYALLFEPRGAGSGPSGLADWPRPFVFRAHHLDGTHVQAGGSFHFDLHLFDVRSSLASALQLTFAQLARQGLGAERRPAELVGMTSTKLALPLLGNGGETAVRLRFVTPTELKNEALVIASPEFGVLAARLRDRVATLCLLYGDGAPPLDFKGFGERAALVRMTECAVRAVAVKRRSSRTGQVHPMGGFVGEAAYAGPVGEFLPWLRAAYWTGVGRQTVWGKGVIEIADKA